MAMNMIWVLTPLLIGIYCIVQAIRDFRRRQYLLAAIGAACVLLLWTLPIETHAVKLDLGIVSPR